MVTVSSELDYKYKLLVSLGAYKQQFYCTVSYW